MLSWHAIWREAYVCDYDFSCIGIGLEEIMGRVHIV